MKNRNLNEFRYNYSHGKEVREKIYKYIVGYFRDHGYAPSFREIGKAVGLKSTASVANHIETMIAEGQLATDAPPGTPRAIRVTGFRFEVEK